jgi:ABC-type lipoprotein release transport system permease subunit
MPRIAFWLRVAALFLWRSGRVTLVLSLMILVAVAALVFLSATAAGINDAMIRNSVGLFSGHIAATHLPGTLAPEALQVAGVDQVLPRRPTPGMLSAAGRLAPVTLMRVVPALEKAATGLPRKIVRGRYLTGAPDEILVSAHLAEQLAVGVGERLVFRGGNRSQQTVFTICGIYRTEVDRLDYGLAFAAGAERRDDGEPWQAALFLAPGVAPPTVIERLEKEIAGAAVFKSWAELMPDLRELIDLNRISMALVTVLVFSVVAIGVACAFVVFVLKNIREYGIMRSMGVTVGDMAALIGAEILLLSLMAALLGVLTGALAVALTARSGIDLTAFTAHNRYFTVSGMIYPRATPKALLAPPLVAVGFSLLASLWPITLIGRKKVADILRIV